MIATHPRKLTTESLASASKLGPVGFGTWSGGRFMHFGEVLSEERYINCIVAAFEQGIRTFVTADVYGVGQADKLLGKALQGIPRNEYQLVGMIGHDFYTGKRKGNGGYPRFTDPELRSPAEFGGFLKMACETSLVDCGTDYFDLLMLHNPDEIGYTSPSVWAGFSDIKEAGLTKAVGIAPGPANGFTLDLIDCFENFSNLIDWAMVILNPLEPWPVGLGLEAAEKHGVKVITRVLDHGGVFNGDLKPGHEFGLGDHRTYRPDGWVERGYELVQKIEPLAKRHGLTVLQYAAAWNLSHPAVECVLPTFIQERGEGMRSIEDKIAEMAQFPNVRIPEAEVNQVREWGDNTGCMLLKGASQRHSTSERCDEWPMRPELYEIAHRYDLGLDW